MKQTAKTRPPRIPGLPEGAPDRLESANGSVLEVLPPEQRRPFRALGIAFDLFPVTFVGLMAIALCVYLAPARPSEARRALFDHWEYLLTGTLVLVFAAAVVIVTVASSRRPLFRYLARSRAQGHESPRTKAAACLPVHPLAELTRHRPFPADHMLLRAFPGYLAIDGSAFRARIVAEDLDLLLVQPETWFPLCTALVLPLGSCDWRIAFWNSRRRFPNLFLSTRGLAEGIQKAVGIDPSERPIPAVGYEEEEPVLESALVSNTSLRDRLNAYTLPSGCVFGCLMFLGMAAFLAFAEPTCPGGVIASFTLAGLAMIAASIMLWRRVQIGTWTLDAAGARFVSRKGDEMVIPWESVTQVQWVPSQVKLEGAGKEWRIGLFEVKESEIPKIRNYVKKQLSHDFDLRHHPVEGLDTLHGLGALSALPAPFVAAAALPLLDRFTHTGNWWAVAAVVALLVAPIAGLLFFGLRADLLRRRANPPIRKRIEHRDE